mmetsp:Transcript_5001/g.10792  ORF Transcript_5001/g.10792 Transcript_5001/m.10792 type:complete len:99 (-) Transcript_5001:2792-3088(-)
MIVGRDLDIDVDFLELALAVGSPQVLVAVVGFLELALVDLAPTSGSPQVLVPDLPQVSGFHLGGRNQRGQKLAVIPLLSMPPPCTYMESKTFQTGMAH